MKNLIIAIALAFVTSTLFAHNGGRDSYGCHHDRKRGGYHCHTGEFAGKSFSSKEDMLNEKNKKKK